MNRIFTITVLVALTPALAGCIVGDFFNQENQYGGSSEISTSPIIHGPFTGLPVVLEKESVWVQSNGEDLAFVPRWLETDRTEAVTLHEDGSTRSSLLARSPPEGRFISRIIAWGDGIGVFLGSAWPDDDGEPVPMVGLYSMDDQTWKVQEIFGGDKGLLSCVDVIGVVHEGRAYFASCRGGESYETMPDVWEVDPRAATIKVVGELAVPVMGAAVAVLGSKAYVIGGLANDIGVGHSPGNVDTIQVMDLETGEAGILEQRLPIPMQRAAAAQDGKQIYLFGGRPDGSSILRFDVSTNDVQVMKARIPGPRYDAAASWTGDRFILAGGVGSVPWMDVMAYDPAKDSVDSGGISRWELPAVGNSLPGTVLAASPAGRGFIVAAPHAFGSPELYKAIPSGWASQGPLSALGEYAWVEWAWARSEDLPQCPLGCPVVAALAQEPARVDVLYHHIGTGDWNLIATVPAVNPDDLRSVDVDDGQLAYLIDEDGNVTLRVVDLSTGRVREAGALPGSWISHVALDQTRAYVVSIDYYVERKDSSLGSYALTVTTFDLSTGDALSRPLRSPVPLGLDIQRLDVWAGKLVGVGIGGITCSHCPSVFTIEPSTGIWTSVWAGAETYRRDSGWGALGLLQGLPVVYGYPDESPPRIHPLPIPAEIMEPVVGIQPGEESVKLHPAGAYAAGSASLWVVDELAPLFHGSLSGNFEDYEFAGWDCCFRRASMSGSQLSIPLPLGWPPGLARGYGITLLMQAPEGSVSTQGIYLLPDASGFFESADTIQRPAGDDLVRM